MGYMIVFGSCLICGNVFGFNPHTVPSSRAVTGKREPICRACVKERINPRRKKAGLPPIVPAHDAYDPAEVL